MVSVLTPHNLDSGVSDVSSMLNLIEFVLKACSFSASSMPSVSFLTNLFLSHLRDSSVAISTVCPVNSPFRAVSFYFFISSLLKAHEIFLLIKHFLILSSL